MTDNTQLQEQPSEYCIDDLGDLLDLLYPVYTKWRIIGIHFKLPLANLDLIHANHSGDTQECFCKMISIRLKQGPITVKELSTILRRPSVRETVLADEIEQANTPNDEKVHPNITKSYVLHCIHPRISETIFPYTHFKKVYSKMSLVPFTLFLLLQIFSLLDDPIFRPKSFPQGEYLNRVIFFILRIVLFAVTPSVCYWQLRNLAMLEKKFTATNIGVHQVNLPPEAKIEMYKTLAERKVLNPLTILQLKTFSKLKGIEVIHFQALIHATVFPIILYCLDAFHAAHSHQPIGATESWRQRLTVKGVQIFEVWDCIAVTIILFLSGNLRDLYCLENRMATLLSESAESRGGNLSKVIFRAIRQRWFLIDSCLQWVSALIAGLTVTLLVCGEPFISSHTQSNALEQNIWNILTVLLTILQLGGSSASPDFKLFSIIGYFATPLIILIGLYISEAHYEIDTIRNGLNFYLAPGNVSLLLFTSQTVTYSNWLFCLLNSFWRQNELRTWTYHCCLGAIVVVTVCLYSITIRECFALVHL